MLAIIKQDVVAAANAIYNNRCSDLNLLNKATIVLIPKKEGVDTIQGYRPISLIHAFCEDNNQGPGIAFGSFHECLDLAVPKCLY